MDHYPEFSQFSIPHLERATRMLWEINISDRSGGSEAYGVLTLQAVLRHRAKALKAAPSPLAGTITDAARRSLYQMPPAELSELADVVLALAKTSAIKGNKAHPGRLMCLWGAAQGFIQNPHHTHFARVSSQ